MHPKGPKGAPGAAIVTQLTYQRTDLRNCMIDPVALERNCPLDNGRGATKRIDEYSCSNLGDIDTLPPELYTAVLLQLDLQTLTKFRSVNQRARLVVDSIPQYREILTHSPNTLRAVLSTGLGPHLTPRDLHNALCSQACAQCGDFGAFLYLFTCSRLCFLCLTEESRFLPMTTTSAKEAYGLSSTTISTLPTLRSLPGSYSHLEKTWRKRVTLIDREAARQAGISIHGSATAMEQYVSRRRAKIVAGYEERVRKNPKVRKPSCPPYTNQFDGKGGNPYRFMGTIRAPSLDRTTKIVEIGLSCDGCRRGTHLETEYGWLDWRRMYTEKGFHSHLAECPTSQAALEVLPSVPGCNSTNHHTYGKS